MVRTRSAFLAQPFRLRQHRHVFRYWLTRHNRLIGLTKQQPFEIPYAREHSVFWRATEERLAGIRAFFRRLKPFISPTRPRTGLHYHGRAVMTRGKEVFAESCRRVTRANNPRRMLIRTRRRKGLVRCGGDEARFLGE